MILIKNFILIFFECNMINKLKIPHKQIFHKRNQIEIGYNR